LPEEPVCPHPHFRFSEDRNGDEAALLAGDVFRRLLTAPGVAASGDESPLLAFDF